jgi:hypothetical protein
MSFSFSSIGHAIASGLNDAYTGMKAVSSFIDKVATPTNQAEIEALTALIPSVGPEAVTIERAVFAVAGEVAAVLNDVTNGGEQKLLDAGFDATVIADFKTLIASIPGLFTATSTATTTATNANSPA